MEQDFKINFQTEGIEKATEQLDVLADALDGFPAQLTIKNCHDCTFYINPSQIKMGGSKDE